MSGFLGSEVIQHLSKICIEYIVALHCVDEVHPMYGSAESMLCLMIMWHGAEKIDQEVNRQFDVLETEKLLTTC